jgi:hypothetical protein
MQQKTRKEERPNASQGSYISRLRIWDGMQLLLGSFIDKAIIYGSLRNVDNDDVLPYKLISDFKKRGLEIISIR